MADLTQRKVLLSISILISNRPDTVEKCLKSLDSLRGRVPSELILVDTGCGEQVRKIMEPYADKIVEFEWCNDFSKARNAGLKQAGGEWFLYLDDDEWFEDTAELEDFFLSDKHLRYNYGGYLVRNYFDLMGKEYRDVYVGRLIRLDPDTEFVHAIHETFSKVRGAQIRLHSYVHHYGYAFRNEEEKKKHSQRNLELLLAEHEREPGELHHAAHLIREYNALKEWEKSIRISWEGIRNADQSVSTEQYMGGLYVNIVRNHINLGKYANAVRAGEEYLQLDNSDEIDRAAVCYNLCIAYLEMREYTKSLEAAERYLRFYEKWRENREATVFYEFIAIAFMDEVCRQAALCIAVQDGIKTGKDALAKKYFDEIDWNVVHDMMETKGVQDMVQALVLEILFTDADTMKVYTAMMKALLEDGTLTGMAAEEIYRNLRKEPAAVLMRAKEVGLWEIARKEHADMERVIAGIPLYRWEEAAEKTVETLGWGEIQELQGYLQEVLDADSFYLLYWNIPYRMRKICLMMEDGDSEGKNENDITESVVRELLAYAAENERLCRRLYREELFDQTPELLPQGCQASLKLKNMAEAAEEGDFQRALSDVREALEIMPQLSNVLKYCTNWLSEQSESRNAEQKKARDEMRTLAEAVKAQACNLAAQGMPEQAVAVLRQLRMLVPEDSEIPEMEKRITQMSK